MIWDLDPVAFSVFGVSVRWYGISYIASFFLVLHGGWYLLSKTKTSFTKKSWEDLLFLMFLWGIIGGRLGEFLFYSPQTFWQNPLEVLKIWHGGMSIHGGMLGGFGAAWYFCKTNKHSLLHALDHLVIPLSAGLGLGRIANYINGELVGIPTGTNWGVIFPHIDNMFRHPTQIYEATVMFLLAIILAFLWRKCGKTNGLLISSFLIGYGILRFIVEIWKDYDPTFLHLKMGQILCLGMIGVGIYIFKNKFNTNE